MKKSKNIPEKYGRYREQLEELASLVAQLEPGDLFLLREIADAVGRIEAQGMPKSRLQPFARMRKLIAQMESEEIDPEKGCRKLVQCVESAQRRAEKDRERVGSAEPLSLDEMEYLEMLVGVFCELIKDMEYSDPHLIDYCRRSLEKLAGYEQMTEELLDQLGGVGLLLGYLDRGEIEFSEGHRLMLDILVQVERDVSSMKESVLERERRVAVAPAAEPRFEASFAEEQAALLERMEEDILTLEKGDSDAHSRITAYLESLLEGFASLHDPRLVESLKRVVRAFGSHRRLEKDTSDIDALLAFKDAVTAYLVRFDEGEVTETDVLVLDRAIGACAEFLERWEVQGSGPVAEGACMDSMISADVDAEELKDFLLESPEFMQSAESSLLRLEHSPANAECLNEAFRGFHNIKGSASFLGIEEAVRLAHASEGVLSEARDGKAVLSKSRISLLLEAVDMMRDLLGKIQGSAPGGSYPLPGGFEEMIRKLELHAGGGEPEGGEACKEKSPDGGEEDAGKDGDRRIADGYVKVSTERLDNLIDAVGELVIAQAMVVQETERNGGGGARFSRSLSQLTKITREVQEQAMAMRMVSLKNTFRKMERLARDLAAKSEALIDFSYSGEDTEIDRNMVDELAAPLVHMIRNAVDHGIELPEERASGGKPERGRIRLSAYHEGGNVVMCLEDDGRGLDWTALLQRGKAMGLVDTDAKTSEGEIQQLIFREGISTAREVTDVSGRGVGMGVVKSAVERLRGRVEVDSKPGRGTKFTIRVPLTLAIIDGMVVKVAEEHYVIPSVSILESMQIKKEQLTTVFEAGEAINVRGELIPLYRICCLFGIGGAKEDPNEAIAIILEDNRSRFAVLVDDIIGQQQVVIKPLGEYFSGMEEISGGAVLGSGRVALILDPKGILEIAHAM